MASKLNNRNNKIHTSKTLSGYVKYRFPTTFSSPGFSLSALCFSFLYFPLKNFSFRTSVFFLIPSFSYFLFLFKNPSNFLFPDLLALFLLSNPLIILPHCLFIFFHSLLRFSPSSIFPCPPRKTPTSSFLFSKLLFIPCNLPTLEFSFYPFFFLQ